MTRAPGSYGAPVHGPVLRNVAVSGQPHALARPLHQPGAAAASAPSAADRQAELDHAYQSGHAQGRLEALAAINAEEMAKAHEAGMQQGREAGMAAAREEARAEVQSSLDALDRMLAALPEMFRARIAASEDDMVALCFEAVMRVLGEAAATPAGVRQMLGKSIAQFGARRLAEVRVHADDLKAMEGDAAVAAWLRRREDGTAIRIVADPSIELGGVVLRSPAGTLDARLEIQVDALRNALLSVRASRTAAAGARP